MKLEGIRQALIDYVEINIIPHYEMFDAAHRMDHVRNVIRDSLHYAAYYKVERELVYVAAAFHDLGLSVGREKHHLYSGEMVRNDKFLNDCFVSQQVEIIAQAVEDHRASHGSEPRSIYGRILAEADRQLDSEQVLRRTVQYGLANYPELSITGHFERYCKHLNEKYAEGGYIQLWLPESENVKKLAELREIITDQKKLSQHFFRIFRQYKSEK